MSDIDEVQIDLPPAGLKDFGPAHTALLQRLYAGEQKVLIERELGGGFGGTRVLLVRPLNQQGAKLARQIVKIGPPPALQREQQNYDEHVRKAHPFVAAEVTRYAEWQGLGGIIYNFVGGGRLGQTRTLEEYFQDEQVSAEAIKHTLEDLLDKALGEMWYHQTTPHYCYFDDEYGPHLVEQLRVKIRPHSQDALWPADQTLEAVEGYRQLNAEAIPAEHAAIRPETLVQIEGLVITKVKPGELKLQHPTRPGIVVKVETPSTTNFTPGQAVTLRGEVRTNRPDRLAQLVTSAFANFTEAGVDPQAETLTWGDQTYPNPLRLYPQILSRTLDGKKSLVHGDLHLRNILVDEAGHGWLIDFALVKERHNLYDFIKLETYIRQMVLSRPEYDFSFAEYLQFEAALLDEAVAVPADRMLRKAFEVIRTVRVMAARYVKGNFGEEYWPALFLYNLAMVKYVDNHGAKAARLAFGTAGVVGGVASPARLVKPSFDRPVHIPFEDAERSSDFNIRISITQVIILLERDIEKFTSTEQESFVLKLSQIVNIGSNQIRLLKVEPGSVLVTLEMPEESAQLLISMYLAKEPVLRTLSIAKVELQQIATIKEKLVPPVEKITYRDFFSPFEIGLERLKKQIGRDDGRYSDFLMHETKLKENIRRSRRFGDTTDRRVERTEIIDQLNETAFSTVGVSFNELCEFK